MHTYLLTLLLLLLLLASANEIRAREAIKPATEVGQIIKDLEGEHVNVDGTIQRGAPCRLNVEKDLPTNRQPLYLRPRTTTYWLPNADGQLEIPRGARIELYCGASFAVNGDGLHSIQVRCLHDTTFDWAGEKRTFKDFICNQPPAYVVERLEEPCGDGNLDSPARIYRVGYRLGEDRFVTTMKLCHDLERLETHYAVHRLLPANAHPQTNVKRPKFSAAGHFPGYDISKVYTQKYQREWVTQLFQSVPVDPDSAHSFLKQGEYLTRGHLAAKADFIYASQQRTSFNYLNVAPQWQRFNGGHWQVAEDVTRRLVARLGLPVTVYAGSYGILTNPLMGNASFHLTTDANNNGVLPVPRLFYRVLVEPGSQSGLAVIGVNNPHASMEQIQASYIICPPVDVEAVPLLQRWLQKDDLKKGYLYVCRVADMAQTMGHLPAELDNVTQLIAGA